SLGIQCFSSSVATAGACASISRPIAYLIQRAADSICFSPRSFGGGNGRIGSTCNALGLVCLASLRRSHFEIFSKRSGDRFFALPTMGWFEFQSQSAHETYLSIATTADASFACGEVHRSAEHR